MANVASTKRRLALVAIACVCALVVAAPAAYAFWYVHSDEHVADSGGKGVYEIACTLDASAVGEGVTTGVIFVPEGSTAADCLNEMVVSSNSQNGLDAIHNYDTQAVADALAGKNYTITVYHAEDQKPGTHTTHDAAGTTGENTALERYDNVVITLE